MNKKMYLLVQGKGEWFCYFVGVKQVVIVFVYYAFLEGNIYQSILICYINYLKRKMAETAPLPATEQLNLKVKSQDGQEVFFKIKSTTQLKKLMDAYCQRQSLNVNNVRFLFDGQRLHQNQTPKDLNMENGDEIDVVIQQVGGSVQV